MKNALLALTLLWALAAPAQAPVAPQPLTRAHAHNDYQHTRPLLDALDQGFCSVEADIWLVDGDLLVAHDRDKVKPGRTLQALYLDPLQERVKRNSGRVYPRGPGFTLLVEIKGDWKTTYPVLDRVLAQYADVLTQFTATGKQPKAITAIITGHRSKEMFAGQTIRRAALDGDLADLESGEPADLIPWISANWGANFKWRGSGAMAEADQLKLRGIVTKAHQQGRRVRFWGAPDRPEFWSMLLSEGVDLINTDNLPGLREFLDKAPAVQESTPVRN